MTYLFVNILIYLATVFIVGSGLEEALDVAPQNTAVLKGEPFQLSCGKKTKAAATYITWWSSTRNNIAINDEVTRDYHVVLHRHNTSSVLTSSGHHDTSGTYICHLTYSTVEITAAAEVIVLEQPKCSQTATDVAVEGDVIEYTCEVEYDGHWAPILRWSKVSSDTTLVINQTDNHRAKYKLAALIHRDMHMRPLTCDAYFDENYAKYQLPAGHAINTPDGDVLKNCTTKPLAVHWPPTEDRIMICPEKSTYEGGERVHCTAEINPLANRIRWLNSRNETVSLETLQLPDQPDHYLYSCEVSNVIGRPGNEQVRTARKNFNFKVNRSSGPKNQKPVSLNQQSNESAANVILLRQLFLLFLMNWIMFYIV